MSIPPLFLRGCVWVARTALSAEVEPNYAKWRGLRPYLRSTRVPADTILFVVVCNWSTKKGGRGRHHGDGEGDGDGDGNGDGPTPRGGDGNGDGDGNGNGHGAGDGGFDYYGNYPDFVLFFLSGKSLWHVLQTLVLVPACALQLGHSLHIFLPQAHSLYFLPWACGRGARGRGAGAAGGRARGAGAAVHAPRGAAHIGGWAGRTRSAPCVRPRSRPWSPASACGPSSPSPTP